MFANRWIRKAFIHLLVYFTCGSTFHLIFAPRANFSVSHNRRSGIFKRSSLGSFHQWQYTCMPCRPTCRCFVCVVHTPGTHTLNHKHFPYSTDPCTHTAFTHTPPHTPASSSSSLSFSLSVSHFLPLFLSVGEWLKPHWQLTAHAGCCLILISDLFRIACATFTRSCLGWQVGRVRCYFPSYGNPVLTEKLELPLALLRHLNSRSTCFNGAR